MANHLVSFAQSKEEIDFILNKISQKILFIPLNLETLIYLNQKKISYLNPKYYFTNRLSINLW